MNFPLALKAEIETLEASLKATPDPRLVKLHEAQRLLALYTGGDAPAFAPAPPAPLAASSQPRASGRKASPEGVRAVEAVAELLKNRAAPTPITNLADHIKSLKIKLTGRKQKESLSALMYRSERFQAHGRAGWTLKGIAPAHSKSGGADVQGPLSAPVKPGGEVGHENMMRS